MLKDLGLVAVVWFFLLGAGITGQEIRSTVAATRTYTRQLWTRVLDGKGN